MREIKFFRKLLLELILSTVFRADHVSEVMVVVCDVTVMEACHLVSF
jgi:hypothetical protein